MKMIHLILSSAILLSLSSEVFAQEAENPEPNANAIQDIVVTARRSSESMMTVPVAVAAISGEEISQAGAANLVDIARMVPQLRIERTSGGSGGIVALRGLSTPVNDAGLDQSVGINIDGVQVGRANIISQGFFDVAQVEVLKGPQALFFGKNSPAGVISLRSVNPTDKLEGYVRAGYGFVANERFVEAAIGGPITDTLKARIAVRAMKMDGFIKNTAPDFPATLNGVTYTNPYYPGLPTHRAADRNGREELIGRLTIVFEPNDAFDANLKISGSRNQGNGPEYQAYCVTPLPLVSATGQPVRPDPFGDCEQDNRYANSGIDPSVAAGIGGTRNGDPFSDAWSTITALTMNYYMDDLTLTSVSGFVKLSAKDASSSSYASYAPAYSGRAEKTQTLSQELRLQSAYDGPLNFMLGAFAEKVERSYVLNTSFVGSLFRDPATGKYTVYDNYNDNHGKTYSAFGQLRWKLADDLELAGGVRYTRESKNITAVNTYVNPLTAALIGARAQGDPIFVPFRGSNWSPEATLSWTPASGMLIYAAYKTGYKSGGGSNPARLAAITPVQDLRYGPETAKGAEIGAKTYLADRTVRIEATAYSYLYSDLQVSSFDPTAQPNGASRIANAASARIKGIEFSSEWQPLQGLRLSSAVVRNSARYKDFPNATCYVGQVLATGCAPVPGKSGTQQNLSGRPLTRAPKWTLTGGGSYDAALTSDLALNLNANANYSSGYFSQEDLDPNSYQPGFWLLNGGIKLSSEDSGWEIGLIGRNLTNKYYRSACGARSIAGQYQCSNVRGREVTLQFGYKF